MAPVNQQDWNIRPRADLCARSERPFEDGEDFMSRLLFDEAGGYLREDIALDAWSDELKDGALSVWQSTFRKPPPPSEEPLKQETIEETLRHLMEANDPKNVNSIFILGMQLERKRLLVPRDRKRRPDGLLIRVYEHKASGDMFLIPDPEFHIDEIPEVTQQVAIQLGWIEPEPEPEPEPDPEAEASDDEDSDDEDDDDDKADDEALDVQTDEANTDQEAEETQASAAEDEAIEASDV